MGILDPAGATIAQQNLRDTYATKRRQLVDVAYGDIRVLPGRAVVCLGSDDGPTQDNSVLFPIIRDNNLPWTYAVCAGPSPANHIGIGDTGRITWAQLATMRQWGGEVACHSRTHTDPLDSAFVDEIVNAGDEIAFGTAAQTALGRGTEQYNVDCFVQPGTWLGNHYLDAPSKIDPPAFIGQFARSRYALLTAYVDSDNSTGFAVGVPAYRRYGVPRKMGWDANTLAAIQAEVAKARGTGGLISISGHAFNLDTGGFNTTAQATAILQWLAAERDAGRVELLTLTAAYYARYDAAGRTTLLRDGDFHLETAGTPGTFVGWQAAGAPEVRAGQGPGGENTLALASAADQVWAEFPAGGLRCVRVEFQARRRTAGDATAKARMILRSYNGATQYVNLDATTGGAAGTSPGPWPALADAWQTYALQTTTDPQAKTFRVWPYYSNGGPVEYTNLKLYKQ